MTRATETFEAYLDHLDREGITYKLDETARNVLIAMDMHLNKTKGRKDEIDSHRLDT